MAAKKATTKTPKTKRPKTKFWTTYNPETGIHESIFERAKDAKEEVERFPGNVFLDEFGYQKHAKEVWDAFLKVAGPYVLSERKALR